MRWADREIERRQYPVALTTLVGTVGIVEPHGPRFVVVLPDHAGLIVPRGISIEAEAVLEALFFQFTAEPPEAEGPFGRAVLSIAVRGEVLESREGALRLTRRRDEGQGPLGIPHTVPIGDARAALGHPEAVLRGAGKGEIPLLRIEGALGNRHGFHHLGGDKIEIGVAVIVRVSDLVEGHAVHQKLDILPLLRSKAAHIGLVGMPFAAVVGGQYARRHHELLGHVLTGDHPKLSHLELIVRRSGGFCAALTEHHGLVNGRFRIETGVRLARLALLGSGAHLFEIVLFGFAFRAGLLGALLGLHLCGCLFGQCEFVAVENLRRDGRTIPGGRRENESIQGVRGRLVEAVTSGFLDCDPDDDAVLVDVELSRDLGLETRFERILGKICFNIFDDSRRLESCRSLGFRALGIRRRLEVARITIRYSSIDDLRRFMNGFLRALRHGSRTFASALCRIGKGAHEHRHRQDKDRYPHFFLLHSTHERQFETPAASTATGTYQTAIKQALG